MPLTWARRLRRAAVQSWRRRGELATATALLPLVSFRLRRHGYAPTRAWLDERANHHRRPTGAAAGRQPMTENPETPIQRSETDQEREGRTSTVATARQLGFIVRLAGRLFPDATCLRKALVLRYLLTRWNIPSVIRFGVRRDADGVALVFHAWVEVNAKVVSELPTLVSSYEILVEEPPTDAPL